MEMKASSQSTLERKALHRRLAGRLGLVNAYVQATYIRDFVLPETLSKPRELFDRMQSEYIHATAPEERRYTEIVRAVESISGSSGWDRVLDIGCSNGLFTKRIAPLCRSLTAYDISEKACSATARLCADLANVRVQQMDVQRDPITGQYDMALVLDTLQYLHGSHRFSRAVDRIVQVIRPGGLLVFSGWRLCEELRGAWWQRWFPEGVDAQIAVLARRPHLRLIHQAFHGNTDPPHPDYIDHLSAIFRKSAAAGRDR